MFGGQVRAGRDWSIVEEDGIAGLDSVGDCHLVLELVRRGVYPLFLHFSQLCGYDVVDDVRGCFWDVQMHREGACRRRVRRVDAGEVCVVDEVRRVGR